MIHFFRSLRKQLVTPGKVRSYLLYALGEILLVVAGILIALQVNNWNEEKNLLRQEQKTLGALHSELLDNSVILDSCIVQINEAMAYADSIRSYLSPELADVNIDTLNYWLGMTGETDRCIVRTNILDELQSSGNLNVIQDVQIRREIGRWIAELEELRKEENEWEREFSREYYPYTNKWISWDDVDLLFNEGDPHFFKSAFEVDPRHMLQQFEYANILSIHYWRMRRVKSNIEKLDTATLSLSERIAAKES